MKINEKFKDELKKIQIEKIKEQRELNELIAEYECVLSDDLLTEDEFRILLKKDAGLNGQLDMYNRMVKLLGKYIET
jgi:hypothetical protein